MDDKNWVSEHRWRWLLVDEIWCRLESWLKRAFREWNMNDCGGKCPKNKDWMAFCHIFPRNRSWRKFFWWKRLQEIFGNRSQLNLIRKTLPTLISKNYIIFNPNLQHVTFCWKLQLSNNSIHQKVSLTTLCFLIYRPKN